MPSELFRLFPLGGSRHTTQGALPVPYHVYDGTAVLTGGWVEADAARGLLAGQGVEAVIDRRGRALACIWACEFTQTSLGEHCEVQLSLAVTREAFPPAGEGPFELIRLILLEPGLRLFSAGLWNNTDTAVAYNRELLGLDAQHCKAVFSRGEEGGYLSFRFEDAEERLIFQGDVTQPASQPFWDALLVQRGLGKAGMRRLEATPWINAQVMAPGGMRFQAPCEAQTYLQARSVVLTRYSSEDARLDIGPVFPAALNFRPAFLEYFTGFEFVYLPPYNSGEQ